MPRESFPTPDKSRDRPGVYKGNRDYGDGLSGEMVTARLQGFDPSGVAYVDVQVDANGVVAVSGGGGGGGGPVTIADGADVTQGARTDSAWDGAAASATVVAILKATYAIMDAMQLDTAGIIAQLDEANDYATRLDDTGVGGITYIGKAPAGTSTGSAGWQIKRMTETGADMDIVFADGNANYDNIWDNRAALSYS